MKAFLQEWAKKTRPTEAPRVCNDCPSLPGPLEWSAWVLLCCSDVVCIRGVLVWVLRRPSAISVSIISYSRGGCHLIASPPHLPLQITKLHEKAPFHIGMPYVYDNPVISVGGPGSGPPPPPPLGIRKEKEKGEPGRHTRS